MIWLEFGFFVAYPQGLSGCASKMPHNGSQASIGAVRHTICRQRNRLSQSELINRGRIALDLSRCTGIQQRWSHIRSAVYKRPCLRFMCHVWSVACDMILVHGHFVPMVHHTFPTGCQTTATVWPPSRCGGPEMDLSARIQHLTFYGLIEPRCHRIQEGKVFVLLHFVQVKKGLAVGGVKRDKSEGLSIHES